MSVVLFFLGSDLQGDWVVLLKKKKATTKKPSIPSPLQKNTTLASPWKPTKANNYQEITSAFSIEQSASEQQRGKFGGGKTKQKATPANKHLPPRLFLKESWKNLLLFFNKNLVWPLLKCQKFLYWLPRRQHTEALVLQKL